MTDPNAAIHEMLRALENQITWLCDEWRIYSDLYGTSQERINLFDDTAAHFFGVLQYTLRDSILLQICRLTENPKVCGRETLVLKRLGELVVAKHAQLGARLDGLLSQIKQTCKPIRDWRNSKVAHLNLAAHLDEPNNPPTVFSRQRVNEAIEAIKGYAQTVRKEVFDGEFCYDAVSDWESAKPLLIGMIRSYEGFELQRQERMTGRTDFRDRLRNGKYGRLYTQIEND